MAELQRRGKREWKSERRKDDREGVGGEKERNRERDGASICWFTPPKPTESRVGPGLS